jgi:hypothetical protein
MRAAHFHLRVRKLRRPLEIGCLVRLAEYGPQEELERTKSVRRLGGYVLRVQGLNIFLRPRTHAIPTHTNL